MNHGRTWPARPGFDDLVTGIDPAVAALARQLRTVILEVHPEAVETVRLGDGAATYGVGPRKLLDGYAYIMPLPGYVNLGFYQGAVLPDPATMLEGSGKGLRHVKARTSEQAANPAIRLLLRQGFELRQAERATDHRTSRSPGTG